MNNKSSDCHCSRTLPCSSFFLKISLQTQRLFTLLARPLNGDHRSVAFPVETSLEIITFFSLFFYIPDGIERQ